MWVDGSQNKNALLDLSAELKSSAAKWKISIGKFIAQWLDEKDFVVAKTSGSTGTPKNISLSKKLMQKSAENTASFFGLRNGATALFCLSADNIGGKMMIVRAISYGWKLFCEAPSSSPNDENRIFDFAAMVPLQVEKILDEAPGRLEKFKNIIVGGAPISQRLEKKLQGLESRLYATYGMTETASHVALRSLNGPNRSEYYKVFKSISANQDDRGCLILQSAFFDTDVVTNDLVEFDDFNVFRWLGRYDNVINSGGVKIVPEQVEKKLESLFDRRFYISSKPDESLGQQVVLHIESEPLDSSTEKLLRSELEDLLDKYEMPKKIEYHTAFEETPSGKVKRI